MSGAGLAADLDGNIYPLLANGTFDTTLDINGFPSEGDYGNAFVKLSTANGGLEVVDYFTMSNTVAESNADVDLGSGGTLVLPDMTDAKGVTRHLAVGAGKDQAIYLVDRDNMGKFDPVADNIYQELLSALAGGIFSAPAYHNGRLYYGPVGNSLLAFQFSNARLQTSPVSATSTVFSYPGATPSISANGTSNAIVWATENTNPAVLHAYDATDLSREFYNSNQAGTRDQFGTGNKFITPMIANGKVYVGTTNGVGAFGLLGAASAVSPTTLSFGGQWVGTTSAVQTVTLINPGQSYLSNITVAVSGDFSETNNCEGTLAVGSLCTFFVTFKPTTGGARTGSLSISDSAFGSPQVVPLSGLGEDFTMAVRSEASTSATVTPGQTAQYSLDARAVGGFNESVSFDCSGAPPSATCLVSPASATPTDSGTALMVNVSTIAPSVAQNWRGIGPEGPSAVKWAWLAVVMLLLILPSIVILGRWRKRTLLGACTLAFTLAAGCGGAGSDGRGRTTNPGTPSGTYTLIVTGSSVSSSATLTHSVSLQLVVD
jgi:hypothetical protein